jgi:hypothetical protein
LEALIFIQLSYFNMTTEADVSQQSMAHRDPFQQDYRSRCISTVHGTPGTISTRLQKQMYLNSPWHIRTHFNKTTEADVPQQSVANQDPFQQDYRSRYLATVHSTPGPISTRLQKQMSRNSPQHTRTHFNKTTEADVSQQFIAHQDPFQQDYRSICLVTVHSTPGPISIKLFNQFQTIHNES